jgi:aspartate/methionine/tyrosine aminotransferase
MHALNPFKLERYFARYEFKVKYILSASDCEGLAMADLLGMASPESLKLWQELKLSYTESQGHPLLRAEVAGLYQHIAPDDVVIAAPEEAIFITMQALLKPDDHVIVVSPAYQSLFEIAASIGCRVTRWMLSPGAGGWRLDLAALEQAITPQTRLLVVNFPNNPTGYLPSRSDWEAMIALARSHQITIFSDEMYRLLERDAAARLPAMCDAYERGISLSGLSKSFALPGLRLGWLATQSPDWTAAWLHYKDYTTICLSAPSEILGIIALQNKESILQRNRDIIAQNIAIAGQFFGAQRDYFSWIAPQAGSVAFPQWLGGAPVEQLCQEIFDQRGVMIVPGSLFDYPGNYFRIGLGRKNFGEAIEQVNKYMGSIHPV